MFNPDRPRLLFDTNILLDSTAQARPESREARELLRRCNGEGELGFVTPSSLSDAFYVLSREFDRDKARGILSRLMELVAVLPMSSEECLLSIMSNEPDFEDGLVRACAELNDIDFIITRDVKAFKRSRVRSMTCSEYLETFPLETLA